MAGTYDAAFESLKETFAPVLSNMLVAKDLPGEYTLNTTKSSPYPQHKGEPMFFASVKKGKAYASLHLFPLYVCPELKDGMSQTLSARMQGLSCFNFKAPPDAQQMAELKKLVKASLSAFKKKKMA